MRLERVRARPGNMRFENVRLKKVRVKLRE